MYNRQTRLKPQGEYRRRSHRKEDHDYSSAGYYYSTICTRWHRQFFCDVVDGQVQLNDVGSIVQATWMSLPERFPGVTLDRYIIMPNRIHGIIVLPNEYPSELFKENKDWTPPSFGAIMRAFKAAATHRIRHTTARRDFAWQSDCYDRVIRDHVDLHRIRKYIIDNPKNWEEDEFFKKINSP